MTGLTAADGHARRGDRDALEIRLVRHVARQRGIVTEHDVLDDRLTRANRLEEVPEVRAYVVVIGAAEGDRLRHRHLADLGIVLLVPLLEVCVS